MKQEPDRKTKSTSQTLSPKKEKPVVKQEAGHSKASGLPVFGQQQLLALGLRLRELRETRRWSLKHLASESGVSVAAIQKIEVGAANTSLLTVLALSEALGEPMDRLVRTSQLDTRARKLVHVAIPRRPARDIDLTAGLPDAHLNGQVMVVRAGTKVVRAPAPDSGPTFAYVIAGKLDAEFSDGSTQSLATGDAMHLSVPEHMTWSNPHKTDAQVLCVIDPRERSDAEGIGLSK